MEAVASPLSSTRTRAIGGENAFSSFFHRLMYNQEDILSFFQFKIVPGDLDQYFAESTNRLILAFFCVASRWYEH
jgi:hypothetical protein